MSVLLLSIIVRSASGIFIELESSTIGSEPKEYSATLSNSASVSNSVSVPNLDNAAGIKQSERNWETFLTWIQSKQKQTTTVGGQTIDQGSTSHESKLDIGQWANFVTASEQKSIKAIQYLHQNLRHLKLFWILDYKNVFKFQIRICSWLLVGT